MPRPSDKKRCNLMACIPRPLWTKIEPNGRTVRSYVSKRVLNRISRTIFYRLRDTTRPQPQYATSLATSALCRSSERHKLSDTRRRVDRAERCHFPCGWHRETKPYNNVEN